MHGGFSRGRIKMFTKKCTEIDGRNAIILSGLCDYSLPDTLECGQCFRYQPLTVKEGYCEYMTVVGDVLVFVAQRNRDELIFFGVTEREVDEILVPYFSLDRDYTAIREDILSRTGRHRRRGSHLRAEGLHDAASVGFLLIRHLHLIHSRLEAKHLGGI